MPCTSKVSSRSSPAGGASIVRHCLARSAAGTGTPGATSCKASATSAASLGDKGGKASSFCARSAVRSRCKGPSQPSSRSTYQGGTLAMTCVAGGSAMRRGCCRPSPPVCQTIWPGRAGPSLRGCGGRPVTSRPLASIFLRSSAPLGVASAKPAGPRAVQRSRKMGRSSSSMNCGGCTSAFSLSVQGWAFSGRLPFLSWMCAISPAAPQSSR